MDYSFLENIESVFKLILAAIVGVVLGWEREIIGKEAGIRTYALVTLGSCLFSLISFLIFDKFIGTNLTTNLDPTRIASQVVIGVGFIGAGLIIFHENKVRGLTTAAGIWVSSAVGMAIAFDFYREAFTAVILILLILYLTRKFRVDEKLHLNV